MEGSNTQVQKSVMAKTYDESSKWAGRTARLIVAILALAGIIFSFVVLFSCEFVKYEVPPAEILPPAENDTGPLLVIRGTNSSFRISEDFKIPDFLGDIDFRQGEEGGIILYGKSSFGLYRFNPDNLGCREYTRAADDFPGIFRLARVGGVAGALLGVIGYLLILVEFLCCRYPCSHSIILIFFFLATMCQMVSFVIFATDGCDTSGDYPQVCFLGEGAYFSFAAAGLYLVSAFFICCVPKGIPLIFRLRNTEKKSKRDPCCCGFCRRPGDEETAELLESEEEEVAPAVAIMGGHEFKQYYDSNAGVTLQDQHNAAYKRWLEYEEMYDTTLARCKNECSEEDWPEIRDKPVEEIEDEDLRRLMTLLHSQKAESERARENMERIREELDAAVAPLDDGEPEISVKQDADDADNKASKGESKVDDQEGEEDEGKSKKARWWRRKKKGHNDENETVEQMQFDEGELEPITEPVTEPSNLPSPEIGDEVKPEI